MCLAHDDVRFQTLRMPWALMTRTYKVDLIVNLVLRWGLAVLPPMPGAPSGAAAMTALTV